ncbi:MAG: tetratricopeptide repeat protein [Blastocatellia bacterium]
MAAISFVAVLFFVAADCTYAQSLEKDAPPVAALPSAAPSVRTRRQAYQRFIEAQRLKGEALRTRNARLLEDAVKVYKETIQLDPSAAEPHVDLGEIYFFYQSRRDLARAEALEAVKLDPNCTGGRLLLARLYLFSARSENNPQPALLDRALREYEKVAELDPRQAEAWAMLAELYAMKNDAARQAHALEKWAGAPIPNDTVFYNRVMNADLASDQAWYKLSQLYLGQNRNAEAVAAARRAYESNPESNDYARNLIGILRAAGSSADELRIYAQLMKSAGSPALLIGYGSALIRAGKHADAVAALKEFVEFDPSNASAIGLLAIAQRRAGQRPAAVETLKAGLAKAELGVRTDLSLELAQTYEEMGRNDEAIAQYEQVFEGYLSKGALTPAGMPLFGEVVHRLVRVCRRTGNQAKLQSVLGRTRRVIDEHNPLLDVITIEMLREDGKRRESLELARAGVRRYPDDRALRITEALLLSEMKRFKESVELLQTMLKGGAENATEDAVIHVLMSNVEIQAGGLKAAEAAARRALELNPGDGEATNQLASALDRAKRHDESETLLRELIRREPDNATALNNLGYFLVERGAKLPEALKLIEHAVAIEPIQGSYLDSLGWAHHKLGNHEKAREALEKATVYSRRNSTIHEHLGDVLRDLGQLSEARRQWEKALEYSIEADETARLKVKLKDGR